MKLEEKEEGAAWIGDSKVSALLGQGPRLQGAWVSGLPWLPSSLNFPLNGCAGQLRPFKGGGSPGLPPKCTSGAKVPEEERSRRRRRRREVTPEKARRGHRLLAYSKRGLCCKS